MLPDDWLTWLVTAVSVAAAVVGLVFLLNAIRQLRGLEKRSELLGRRMDLSEALLNRLDSEGGADPEDLSAKVRFAAQLSTLAAQINEEIKAAFTLQIAEVERLQKKADDAKAIAELNETAMKAAETLVAGQMDKALKRSKRGDRRWDLFLAAGGVVIGIVATLIIQAITGG